MVHSHQRLNMFEVVLLNTVYIFSSENLYKPMLVDFKYNILKMQISDCMNSMENSVFQSSLSGFHSVKPGLTKNVFLM